ncbi:hypothetical protein BD779DRAFT_510541 [Infundibulicybe gibba]|nr:hypothetical protein BD779DRAFT_510541 [Infundibulicybe gibba]
MKIEYLGSIQTCVHPSMTGLILDSHRGVRREHGGAGGAKHSQSVDYRNHHARLGFWNLSAPSTRYGAMVPRVCHRRYFESCSSRRARGSTRGREKRRTAIEGMLVSEQYILIDSFQGLLEIGLSSLPWFAREAPGNVLGSPCSPYWTVKRAKCCPTRILCGLCLFANALSWISMDNEVDDRLSESMVGGFGRFG